MTRNLLISAAATKKRDYRSMTTRERRCSMSVVYEVTSKPRNYKSWCVRIVRRRFVYGVV
jgi:hypothetical protein